MEDRIVESRLESNSKSENDDVLEKYRKANFSKDEAKLKECFDTFDLNRDGFLDEKEFRGMLEAVFCKNGQSYILGDKEVDDFQKLLDKDGDGKIGKDDFRDCWLYWLKPILSPVSALVIVDVQNDFIDGSLSLKNCPAGQDGSAVVPVINSILDSVNFDTVVYSLDWHPQDHISFIDNVGNRKLDASSKVSADEAQLMDTVVFEGPPLTEQQLWPAHCVQNSWGSKLHDDLKVIPDAVYIYKGTNPNIDSYSAFWDNNKLSQTALVQELTKRGVTDVYCVGLALDICVGSTTLHSIEHGFRTVMVENCCRCVSLEGQDSMKSKIKKAGGIVVESCAVADMVNASDRRPELGYQSALNIAMARKIVAAQST